MHFGNYYHSVIDHLVPALVTGMRVEGKQGIKFETDLQIDTTISEYQGAFYETGVSAVQEFGKMLGMNVFLDAELDSGWYRRLVLGKVHLPTYKYPDIVSPPVYLGYLRPIYSTVSRKLRAGCQSPTETGRIFMEIRPEGTASDRRIKNADVVINEMRAKYAPIFRVGSLADFEFELQKEIACRTNVLIAVDGAVFINQFFMPPNSTLVVIHVPRDGANSTAQQWHRSIAQYLGHRVIDWVIPSNTVPTGDKLEVVVNLALNRAWDTYHLIDDGAYLI